ncbi:hypothetical protein BM221_010532 [Beauveria bassiana]|uniref:Uncharacterized protein n=1 Tax=Beauveria bassiana TaxID=176275 RepID=A0A2N6N8M9_BEABA|nr:hypothetical protein BM221_010532 [Beauveria bassiana]
MYLTGSWKKNARPGRAMTSMMNKFPALLTLQSLSFLVVIQELNVSLGHRLLEQGGHDATHERNKVSAKNTTHATPAVHQVLRLRIICISNASLDISEQVDQSHGVLTESLLSNGNRDQRCALHSLGTEKTVFLFTLILQYVHQKRH